MQGGGIPLTTECSMIVGLMVGCSVGFDCNYIEHRG